MTYSVEGSGAVDGRSSDVIWVSEGAGPLLGGGRVGPILVVVGPGLVSAVVRVDVVVELAVYALT